jgi:arylsulfatase A-like enzyme
MSIVVFPRSQFRRASFARVAFIPLALMISACPDSRAPEQPQVLLDLTEALPVAEISLDSTNIDFGVAEVHERLREGWSIDEGSGETTFVWGTGERSGIELFASDSGARDVEARLWPFSFDSAPRQSVQVNVNDQQVAKISLGSNPGRYQFHIPAGLLQPGDNDIDFHYAYAARPRDVQPPSRDLRLLAVAWAELDFPGREKPSPPTIVGAALVIPARTRVSYHVWLSGSAELTLDSLSVESNGNDDSAAVRVVVSSDAAGELVSEIWREGQIEPIDVPLKEPGPVRISLWGEGRNGTATHLVAPLVLGSPTIELPFDATSSGPASPGTNVLLYVVDTLRSDHLGAYGYPRDTSPRIDALAASGVTFLRARANAPWTRPSIASILTGLAPSVHGANERRDALSTEVTTLAEIFQDDGYQTAGFITNGNVSRAFGFAQGFDVYEHLKEDMARPGVHVPAEELHQRGIDWLDARDPARPFFLYFHASDPHGPYTPRESYRRQFALGAEDRKLGTYPFLGQLSTKTVQGTPALRDDLVDLYDAEIAYLDEQLGWLMDQLDERGLQGNLLVVITADHGEEFLDHGGWEHGKTVFAEQLNVPLIFRLPGEALAGQRRAEPAALVDVVPTLLGRLGLTSPALLSGRDLLALGPHDPARPIRALLHVDRRRVDAIEIRGMKLIRYSALEHHKKVNVELFDLDSDPLEQTDLARQSPVTTGFLLQELRARDADTSQGIEGGAAEIEPELERALRALGYLGDD